MTGGFCKAAAELGGLRIDLDHAGRYVDPALLGQSIAQAYKGVVMRPYTAARTGGVVGFGKGMLGSLFGIVALPAVHLTALTLAALSLVSGTAATMSEETHALLMERGERDEMVQRLS